MSAEYDKHCEEFNKLYEKIVIEALEIAFQEIDNEKTSTNQTKSNTNSHIKLPKPKIVTDFEELQAEIDPYYESIEEILEEKKTPVVKNKSPKKISSNKSEQKKGQEKQEPVTQEFESYYQTPNGEPYYEVPKTKPVPLYENVQLKTPPPPQCKPPPPPIDEEGEGNEDNSKEKENDEDTFKRINSTKRIKKELWNKRSSFLGIEGPDDSVFELNVAPPPDMSAFLEEERRLQRQLIMKTGFSDTSDTGESRDSGVSENHSRQSSGPFSVEEIHETPTFKSSPTHSMPFDEETRLKNIEKKISEQENRYHIIRPQYDDDTLDAEEVLRVERELLQLEKEELNRQRSNLMQRENLSRHELGHGDKILLSAHNSVNPLNSYNPHQAYQVETEYRKSMPDLQTMIEQQKRFALNAPEKPLRSQFQQEYLNANPLLNLQNNNNSVDSDLDRIHHTNIQNAPMHPHDFVQLRNHPEKHSRPHTMDESNIYANMSKHTLHSLSATPKPRFTNDWVQHSRNNNNTNEQLHTDLHQETKMSHYQNTNVINNNNNSKKRMSEWIPPSHQQPFHQKRKSEPFNYQNHWLIQEAEQRRLESGVRSSNRKPLPDSVIQTITQRVQNLGIGERRRSSYEPNYSVSNSDLTQPLQQDMNEKILSVSGKKKCSKCGNELGRGAAMVIESLRLFYHIDCFKCFVCHTRLGDGLGGTDVRVRNSKLHCQNCYSSDDGVKFSCV